MPKVKIVKPHMMLYVFTLIQINHKEVSSENSSNKKISLRITKLINTVIYIGLILLLRLILSACLLSFEEPS